MDGIHDLGGMQGFGPVPVKAGDEPFHHEWEKRMWGIARSGVLRDITIDWFRHSIERMVPSDYLAFRYFNKWATTYLAILVDNGVITLDEAAGGASGRPAKSPDALSVGEVLERSRAGHISFLVETDASAAFAPGDVVRTRRRVGSDHTRLPRYAAAARGTVTAHHGSHAMPDRGARGEHVGEHLYTVEFTAPELWGEEADPRDTVRLELWESYLVRA